MLKILESLILRPLEKKSRQRVRLRPGFRKKEDRALVSDTSEEDSRCQEQ